jgi:hypothetical protein
MPCQSAGAGLVALGAIRFRLSVAGSDDSNSHFQRLQRLASQANAATYLRNDIHRGIFRLEHRADGLWARRGRLSTAIAIFPRSATPWRIDGEPPVQVQQGTTLLCPSFYEALGRDLPAIAPSNLKRSDSAICLAGRVAGQIASVEALNAIRFRMDNQAINLGRLLTVHACSNDTVSRIIFFNSRTGQFDRQSGLPNLVVADGDAAFLKVINADHFRNSDVVGVIHRAIERDRLELVGNTVADLAQWYVPDPERLEGILTAPRGISVSTFRRRQT